MSLGTEFESVLCAAQAGAEWAVDVLFREYQPPLLRYLRACEPRAAEDLAGEVWLALAPKLAEFTGDEAGFRGWLFTVARRRLMGHRRQAVRRQTAPVPREQFDDFAAGDDTAAEGMATVATQQAVDRLVAHLSREQAEVVLLRVVAGLPVAEVARITGRTAGAVRVMQHRALRKLAEIFSEEVVTQ
jgi:RNA polymerase sigma-70 factor (ECF subfamily)